MVRLDSNKQTFPIECRKKFDKNYFEEIPKQKPLDQQTGNIETYYRLKKEAKILGIKNITISENQIEIETSAKILQDKYLQGINKNTIDYFIRNINATGIIELDFNEYMDSSILHRFDVTDMVYLNDTSKVLRDIAILASDKKYYYESYKTGFVITSKAKTNKERMLLYLKAIELSKPTKSNKELLKYVKIEDAKNDLRVEQNYRNYQRIRKAFRIDTKTFRLSDILNSKEKPNYETFKRMFDIDKRINKKDTKMTEQNLMIHLHNNGYKLSQIIKELGNRQIIKLCNNDYEAIRKNVISLTKGNPSRFMKEIKDLMLRMKYEKLDYDISSIEEIQNLLKAN